ncbi:MAG TPA: DUF4397 domain-containing protein [Mucilaginibacter sp.]|jgi:hypothetical protein
MNKRNNYQSGFLLLFVAVFLVMPFVSSCGKSGTVSPSALNIQYQVVNLSPNLGSVDLYINFTKVNSFSYFYPNASGYFFLNKIDTPFQIRPGTSLIPGTIAPSRNIFTFDTILKPNGKYTLMIVGINKPDSLLAFVTRDDTVSLPATGRGKIRFINASPRSAGVDVTANGTPIFSGQIYPQISAFVPVPAGTYDFQIFPKGGSTVLRDVPNVVIQDGRIYTFYCYGQAGRTDSLAFGSGIITNR